MAEQEWRLNALLAADLVVLTIREHRLKVLLITRGTEPFRGMLALPGGFMKDGESIDDAARRELAEETSLDASILPLRQLKVYSAPGRDPRSRVVAVAFLAIAPDLPVPVPESGADAERADWVEVEPSLFERLAFDHALILGDGLERARQDVQYTNLATGFCSEHFTIPELRRVFEIIWNVKLDAGNFKRKVDGIPGFVRPVGRQHKKSGPGRPADLYCRGDAIMLDPPMRRPNVQNGQLDDSTTVNTAGK